MALQYRGMLIHVTHVDPNWLENKPNEEPFDLQVALDLLEPMARCGMNLLVVDVEDGVKYRSHPEMTRHYSVPIDELRVLAQAARDHGIDVVPKLNFAKSGRNFHDIWMKPHWEHVSWLKGMDKYYAVARDVMTELVEVMRPGRFFHIGMDEDHYRSLVQYVDAVETLRGIVTDLGLRTIVWNDSSKDSPTSVGQVHAEKCRAAEEHISKDIVHILWDYERAHGDDVRRISQRGFEVWAAPGPSVERTLEWRGALESNGGSGMLMVKWIKCSERNRATLENLVTTVGPAYA